MNYEVTEQERRTAGEIMNMIRSRKSVDAHRYILAEFVCAMNEMQAYGEQWKDWHGDGPDWLRRLAIEAMEILGVRRPEGI